MVQVIDKNGLSSLMQAADSRSCLLFLHGFPDTKEIWLPIINRLPADISLLAPDLPSFGDSQLFPDSEMKVSKIAARITQLVNDLGFDSVSLIAHDWGSMIAWEILAQTPSLVKRMILANGPQPQVYHRLLATSSEQQLIAKYASFFCRPDAALRLSVDNLKALKLHHPFHSLDQGPGSETYFEAKWSDAERLSASLGIYRANLPDLIAGKVENILSDTPVSILWGKDDHSLVIEQGQMIEKQCRGEFKITWVNGGHWAFLDQLDQLENMILEY